MNSIVTIIIVLVYLGIGFAVMMWIQRDNEFRESEMVDFYAYGSVILWPVLGPVWLGVRPDERLEDLASKKTYHDFKRFMKERKGFDQDLLSRLEKSAEPDEPMTIRAQPVDFRDYHLEELIEQSKWMEGLRTANDMLRFAREQQENERVAAYERYIREIKDKRRQEMA